jgi:hypothetical protein
LFGILCANGLVSEPDRALFRIVKSPEEAANHIAKFWSRYRGCEVLGAHTVLRLSTPITSDEVVALQQDFADLSPVAHANGLAVEVEGKHFSRVRELIDALSDTREPESPAPADDGKLFLLKLPEPRRTATRA